MMLKTRMTPAFFFKGRTMARPRMLSIDADVAITDEF
jgi:hypothetical protein